jgi:hypothetical protein
MRLEWETAHKVTEELVEGPPSRRANATFIPCPSGNYLWCIGGEFFSEDKKAVSLFPTPLLIYMCYMLMSSLLSTSTTMSSDIAQTRFILTLVIHGPMYSHSS